MRVAKFPKSVLLDENPLGSGGGGGQGDRAAQFDGTNRLTAPNTGGVFSVAGNTDLHVVFWFVVDTFPTSGADEIMNVTGNNVTKDGWFTYVTSAQRLAMGSCDGAGYGFLVNTSTLLSTAHWYFAHCWWDNSGGAANYTMSLYDTGALLSSVSTGGLFINNAIPQPLNMGGGIAPQTWLKGRMDKVGIWGLPNPSPLDGTGIWNSGAGLTGAELVALPAYDTGRLGWWDLDEQTGAMVWSELGGLYDAIPTGTVVSVPPAGEF